MRPLPELPKLPLATVTPATPLLIEVVPPLTDPVMSLILALAVLLLSATVVSAPSMLDARFSLNLPGAVTLKVTWQALLLVSVLLPPNVAPSWSAEVVLAQRTLKTVPLVAVTVEVAFCRS